MDIIEYISEKTINNQDASLNDTIVRDILSDNKSYVKEAGASSFITAKGEYEIPYSELYTASETTPPISTDLASSFGFNSLDNTFIGQLTNNPNRTCNGNSEFENGYKFTQSHFIFVENYIGENYSSIMGENGEDAYFVWDENPYGEITQWRDCFNCCDNFDIYFTNGIFCDGVNL